jgi:hypothetical protein
LAKDSARAVVASEQASAIRASDFTTTCFIIVRLQFTCSMSGNFQNHAQSLSIGRGAMQITSVPPILTVRWQFLCPLRGRYCRKSREPEAGSEMRNNRILQPVARRDHASVATAKGSKTGRADLKKCFSTFGLLSATGICGVCDACAGLASRPSEGDRPGYADRLRHPGTAEQPLLLRRKDKEAPTESC